MLKEVPERLTYAQNRIIKLIETRKLRQFCLDNGLQHASLYRIGTGEMAPTYKMISSLVHLIPPIEWLFYTDEELPYEPQLLPPWSGENKSKFIKAHRYDYKDLAKKYDITEISAYNLCVSYRLLPSVAFMRECCKDTNPIDFFTDGEYSEKQKYYPERGDVISMRGTVYLVLSKRENSEKTGYITITPIINDEQYGQKLPASKTPGYIRPENIQTIQFKAIKMNYIETAENAFVDGILEKARNVLL